MGIANALAVSTDLLSSEKEESYVSSHPTRGGRGNQLGVFPFLGTSLQNFAVGLRGRAVGEHSILYIFAIVEVMVRRRLHSMSSLKAEFRRLL